MCVNQRYITNSAIHRSLMVKCGKCPSCQQEKAFSVTKRIRATAASDDICLFITLTYNSFSVPYVLYEDIVYNRGFVNVYRDCSVRRNRVGSAYSFQNDFTYDTHIIAEHVEVSPSAYLSPLGVYRHPRGSSDSKSKVAVCFFKDIQDFWKRLDQNLSRVYGYQGKFKRFCCSELGSHTFRPHFHALVFIKRDDEQIFRDAIVKSWPYADSRRTAEYIELARDAASYVASYVNKSVNFPSFHSVRPFSPKHSYSQDFGMSDDNFLLPSVLDKIERGSFIYSGIVKQRGIPVVRDLFVPKYVVNRYFPKFKGFSRLPVATLFDIISCPKLLSTGTIDDWLTEENDLKSSLEVGLITDSEYQLHLLHTLCYEIGYTLDDLHKISVRLRNAYLRYCSILGDRDYIEYCWDYIRAWQTFERSKLQWFYMQQNKVECVLLYDNIDQYLRAQVRSLDLDEYISNSRSSQVLFENGYYDANSNPVNVIQTKEHASLFDSYNKYKSMNNIVMAENGHDV